MRKITVVLDIEDMGAAKIFWDCHRDNVTCLGAKVLAIANGDLLAAIECMICDQFSES